MMEVFAGFLSHTDHHLGRLVDFLREQGVLENTIVMVISDNGASAEGGPAGTTNEAQFFNNAQETLEESLAVIDEIGGPEHFNHYPWGWTWAGNTPFRRWKRETYRGGSTDPFIVSWPAGVKARGEVRTQYAHIIDMVPTVLELLGIEPPAAIRGVAQAPLHGVSFAGALDDTAAPNRHHTQYFEMLGHRAIYKDGWRAVCPWPGPSFAEAGTGFGNPISAQRLTELDATGWELYHTDEDPAENHDLAAEHRDKLIELIGTWYVEAGKTGSCRSTAAACNGWSPRSRSSPCREISTSTARAPSPSRTSPRRACSTGRTASPRRSGSPRAAPRASCSARGPRPAATRCTSRTAGCTTSTTTSPGSGYGVSSADPLPAGRHELRFELEPTGMPDMPHGKGVPARLQLYVDGTLVASADAPYTTPFMFNPGGVSCGHNPGSPVTPEYRSPFRFTGDLEKVVVDVSGELIVTRRPSFERTWPGSSAAPREVVTPGGEPQEAPGTSDRRPSLSAKSHTSMAGGSMPSAVRAVHTWLRWSVPWCSAWASRIPSGAWLAVPSSRWRTRSASGSRSPAMTDAQAGPLATIAARSAARSMPASSISGRAPPLTTNRYEASAPTRCRIVSMIEPYVPGTPVSSWSGGRARHASRTRMVAHVWCPKASASTDLVIGAR